MYDTTKNCSCGFKISYGSENDIRKIRRYKFCPLCANILKKDGFICDL